MGERRRQCVICETEMAEKTATAAKPYPFVDSGLKGVFLVGIKYYVCKQGHTFAQIPAIEQLMRILACTVARKPGALSGDEVRFLRKRLGQKAADFAQSISVKPESLSRIENGRQAAGEGLDKLVRYHYALKSQDPVLLAELAGAMESRAPSKKKPTSARIEAKVASKGWETKLAA
jgi:transcriptional regulator with XRE-family HTH domain